MWAGKKCKHTAWPDHLRKGGRQVSIVHIHARRLGTSSRARMRTCKDALHDLHLVGRQPTRHLRQLVCAPARTDGQGGGGDDGPACASLPAHFSGSSVFRHAAQTKLIFGGEARGVRKASKRSACEDDAYLDVGEEGAAQSVT